MILSQMARAQRSGPLFVTHRSHASVLAETSWEHVPGGDLHSQVASYQHVATPQLQQAGAVVLVEIAAILLLFSRTEIGGRRRRAARGGQQDRHVFLNQVHLVHSGVTTY